MASFKFETPEEQSAFVRLLNLIPRKQAWEDVKGYAAGTTCHICNGVISVKSGIVPFDDFFEEKKVGGYNFWNCCNSCHNNGWQLPRWVTREGRLRYWRIGPTIKAEEHIVTNLQIFKFPLVTLINLDTVSITL